MKKIIFILTGILLWSCSGDSSNDTQFEPEITSFNFEERLPQNMQNDAPLIYSQVMSIWLMANFIASSISQVPILLNKQKQFFLLSIFGTTLLIFSMLLGEFFPYFSDSFDRILLFVSIGQALFLFFVVFWILFMAKKYSND